MYHGQRVAISVLCGANQFEPQIGPWGRYATLYKTVYTPPSPIPISLWIWIHPSLSSREEKKRPGLLHLLLRGKEGGGALSAPLLRVIAVAVLLVPLVILLLPLLLLLLPLPPPSRGVYLCVARQVIVVLLRSACSLAFLQCCFRGSTASLAEVPTDPWRPPPRG